MSVIGPHCHDLNRTYTQINRREHINKQGVSIQCRRRDRHHTLRDRHRARRDRSRSRDRDVQRDSTDTHQPSPQPTTTPSPSASSVLSSDGTGSDGVCDSDMIDVKIRKIQFGLV